MKQKVNLSGFSLIFSFACLAILLWVLNYARTLATVITIGVLIGVLIFMMFFYMPLSVSATPEAIIVNRTLKKKMIPINEIAEIRLCPPTMAANVLIGSRGFCGYWGWFRERDLGRYFAYYGKSSDCFLIILKDGRKYIIGCEDPGDIVRYVENRMSYNS